MSEPNFDNRIFRVRNRKRLIVSLKEANDASGFIPFSVVDPLSPIGLNFVLAIHGGEACHYK